MMDKHLYFARLEHFGQMVAGGHFLAASAADAKDEALKAFGRDAGTALAAGLRPLPSLDACVVSVKRSKASLSQAMNAEAA